MTIRNLMFGLLAAATGFVGSWIVLLTLFVLHGERSSGLGLNLRNYLISVSIPVSVGTVIVYAVTAWIRSR